MKRRIKNLFLVPALSAGLGLTLAGRVTAQTFTTLYNFTATTLPPCPCPNSDGDGPNGLILSGSTLYGTAQYGGSPAGGPGRYGYGTVFKVNADGSRFSTLYRFTPVPYDNPPYTNSDGAFPRGLVLSGNTLYGTANGGG